MLLAEVLSPALFVVDVCRGLGADFTARVFFKVFFPDFAVFFIQLPPALADGVEPASSFLNPVLALSGVFLLSIVGGF